MGVPVPKLFSPQHTVALDEDSTKGSSCESPAERYWIATRDLCAPFVEGHAIDLSEPAGSVVDGMDVYQELLPELREVSDPWSV